MMKNIKKKINIRNLNRSASYISVCLGIGLIIMACALFFIGFHNMDVVHNINLMSDDMNFVLCKHGINDSFEYAETTVSKKTVDLFWGWHEGVELQQKGFFIMFLGAFLLGGGLNGLSSYEQRKIRS